MFETQEGVFTVEISIICIGRGNNWAISVTQLDFDVAKSALDGKKNKDIYKYIYDPFVTVHVSRQTFNFRIEDETALLLSSP